MNFSQLVSLNGLGSQINQQCLILSNFIVNYMKFNSLIVSILYQFLQINNKYLNSMHYSGFENPKLSAIRLLRSQGCCYNSQNDICSSNNNISPQNLEGLLRYKQELQQKVALQRTKLSDIPCVLELGKQIEELQQIIDGLARENKQIIKKMKLISKQTNLTFSTQCDDEQEQREHERLQCEYKALLKRLEKVNDRNSTLVSKLINL